MSRYFFQKLTDLGEFSIVFCMLSYIRTIKLKRSLSVIAKMGMRPGEGAREFRDGCVIPAK